MCIAELTLSFLEYQLSPASVDTSDQPKVKDCSVDIINEPVPEIYSSPEPLVDRRSVFVAHVAEVHSPSQVRAVIAKLLENKKVAKATHNIMAYRIEMEDGRMLQDNDDDGETAAGGTLFEKASFFLSAAHGMIRSPFTFVANRGCEKCRRRRKPVVWW